MLGCEADRTRSFPRSPCLLERIVTAELKLEVDGHRVLEG
jgi:hypothetical protein